MIVFFGQIIIDIVFFIVVELGDSMIQLLFNISLSDNYIYLWMLVDYLSFDIICNLFIFLEISQEYILIIVNQNGCMVLEIVFVEFDVNCNVYILNIFSLNVDGCNDEFWVFVCLGV